MTQRDEIITKAVMQKLHEGFDFFTADDVLTVAGIDDKKLTEIRAAIQQKSTEVALPTPPRNED